MNKSIYHASGVNPMMYRRAIDDDENGPPVIGYHDYGDRFEVILYAFYSISKEWWWVIGIGKHSSVNW